MALQRERLVKDKDLPAEVVSEVQRLQRVHEVDAQIVNALEMGNDFTRLWTHPAGINPWVNRGCCKALNGTQEQERLYCLARFNALTVTWHAGREDDALDVAIATKKAAGKEKGDRHLDELEEIKRRKVASKAGTHGPEMQKFARARSHKDFSESRFREYLRFVGALVERTDAELIAEVEAYTAEFVTELNADRAELGLPPVKVVEA